MTTLQRSSMATAIAACPIMGRHTIATMMNDTIIVIAIVSITTCKIRLAAAPITLAIPGTIAHTHP